MMADENRASQNDKESSVVEAEDIEDAVDWRGEPGAFFTALQDAHFIDGKQIHDWDQYAGKLIERRKADAERKRQARSQMSDGCPLDGDGNLTPSCVTTPNNTVPNNTIPVKATTTPRERAQTVVEDAAFMSRMHAHFDGKVNIEWESEKWLDHVTDKPPKGNYKNSLRNWLTNAVKFTEKSNGWVEKHSQGNPGKLPVD